MTETNFSEGTRGTPSSGSKGPPTAGGTLGSVSPLATLEQLSYVQELLRDDNLAWMSLCRELCRHRLPSERFDRVPPGVWRFRPWGHRVVVMRTPRITQQGSIILAKEALNANSSGWVLSVGEGVCERTTGTSLQAGSSPYRWTWGRAADGRSNPLLLVGELVLFNPYGGRALTMNALDEGFVHRTQLPELLICGVGDIYGPNVDPQWFDYAAEQPSALVLPLDVGNEAARTEDSA